MGVHKAECCCVWVQQSNLPLWCGQGSAEKISKALEGQIAEASVKLEQSQRELAELNAAKARALAENSTIARALEESNNQVNLLSKAKQVWPALQGQAGLGRILTWFFDPIGDLTPSFGAL